MKAENTFMSTSTPHRLRIKPRLSCPHCWQDFSTDKLVFISESPDLPPDRKLVADKLRFVPQRYNLAGAALDPHGVPCEKLACPECHLPIPRAWLYLNNFFLSIAGAPSSGKSYFLASMVWQLRRTLARGFFSNFTDADPQENRRIFESEAALFTGSDAPNEWVRIDKTEVVGDIYNSTKVHGVDVRLAQPFTYTTEPMPNHPLLHKASRTRQVICVYDNAGEHFLPGADNFEAPVTRHMAKSDALLFVFDPTRDVRFRKAFTEPVDDPQINPPSGMITEAQTRKSEIGQDVVLVNILSQIRSLNFLPPHEKLKMPLIIVLSKYDAWLHLVKGKFSSGRAPQEREPWKMTADGVINYYNSDRVEKYSQTLRTLLLDLIPNLVSTAEGAVEKVAYIPVSATGGPPEPGNPNEKGVYLLGYRPINVKPIWAEVPFLHAQYLAGKSTVPFVRDGKAVM